MYGNEKKRFFSEKSFYLKIFLRTRRMQFWQTCNEIFGGTRTFLSLKVGKGQKRKFFIKKNQSPKKFLWTLRRYFYNLAENISPQKKYRILRIKPVAPRYSSSHWYYPTIPTLARHFVPRRLPSSQPLAYIIAQLLEPRLLFFNYVIIFCYVF